MNANAPELGALSDRSIGRYPAVAITRVLLRPGKAVPDLWPAEPQPAPTGSGLARWNEVQS